jgi:hypothetical protein
MQGKILQTLSLHFPCKKPPGIRKIHQSKHVIWKVLRKDDKIYSGEVTYLLIALFWLLTNNIYCINTRKVLFLQFPARWRRRRIFAFFCFSPQCSSDATLRQIWELCQEKNSISVFRLPWHNVNSFYVDFPWNILIFLFCYNCMY